MGNTGFKTESRIFYLLDLQNDTVLKSMSELIICLHICMSNE